MKVRNSTANFSFRRQGLKLYRRCFADGVVREVRPGLITKTVLGARKVQITWHPPQSWNVPVRVVEELKAVGT